MDEKVILHLSDWNNQDRYFEMPISLLKDLQKRIKRDGISSAYKWMYEQVDYGDHPKRPIKTGRKVDIEACVDMTLAQFFLDWTEPDTCMTEWDEAFEEDE